MQKQAFLSRLCPVCSTEPSAKVDIKSDVVAEALDFDALVPCWNGFFKEKVFFSYTRCSCCNLLYAPTFFNGQQLEQLYGQMPPNMAEVPMEALRRTQRGYFDVLKSCSDLSGGFIEVGPDIGLFTENCVRDGSYDEYWLFEPNRDVLPTLTKIVEGHKYTVIHDMFGFSHVPDHTVSAAVMIHVLDHLLDPVATLRELREKLKPNARLLLVTHDESSLLRRIVGWRWPAFCLQHPQIYSPESMHNLLEAAGFDVIERRKTVNFFEISFLLKHLLWAFGFKTQSVPSFGRFTLGLKLGNMLTIATPKLENHNV
jgi:SAM-dependent methyltransferase